MKFYRGKKLKYNEELHSNGIYFAHDDNNLNTIIANGHEFGTNYTEVTWQELKDKRDNSKLIPGSLYRITDYQCTTTQENTQSAGHQFDIVLLALSENKLAEEGWAMEHPTDVYDVTFSDGVTIKCYLYENSDKNINIVRTSDLLGFDSGEAFEDWEQSSLIDYNNKTLTFTAASDEVDWITNLQYSYFQNSKLEAWKVWYCLDNDKSRFAWADDSVDEDVHAKIITLGGRNFTFSAGGFFIRSEQYDEEVTIGEARGSYYGWVKDDDDSVIVYTTTDPPLVGNNSYLYIKSLDSFNKASGNVVNEYISAHEGTGLPNGRGVIYRLIDEWNNDCPYDFKNIQFIRTLTDGEYNIDGEETWCYTFSYYDFDNANIMDASLGIKFIEEDNTITEYSKLNAINTDGSYLDPNVFLGISCGNQIINSNNNTFFHLYNAKIISTSGINHLLGISSDTGVGSIILMNCYDDFNGNPYPNHPNIVIQNVMLVPEE